MLKKIIALVFLVVLMSGVAVAGNKAQIKDTAEALSASEVEKKLKALGIMQGSVKYIESASTTEKNWKIYLFMASNEGIDFPLAVYASKKDIVVGVLVVDGKVVSPKIDAEQQVKTNNTVSKTNISKLAADKRIVYNPNGKETVFVFLDPDCPYCRQLESKLATYNGAYKVIMKSFPLETIHRGATLKAIERQCLWLDRTCSQAALEAAKRIVEEDIREGEAIGINHSYDNDQERAGYRRDTGLKVDRMAKIIQHISPLLLVFALYAHGFVETVTGKDFRFIRVKMGTINSLRAELSRL